MHLNHMTLTLEHARCEILPSDPDGWIEVRVEGTMDQAGARGVEGSVRFAAMDAPAGVLIDCTRSRSSTRPDCACSSSPSRWPPLAASGGDCDRAISSASC